MPMSVLNRLFSRALTLDIRGQSLSFHNQADFEFMLSGRTELPAKKLAELMTLSAAELKQEARAIKTVESRFVDIMTKAMGSSNSVGDQLRAIDILVFSQDHDWREIVRALNDKESEYDDLRRTALAKYMQYLRSRQDVIKQLYKIKKQTHDADESIASDAHDSAVPAYLRETSLFDSPPDQSPAPNDSPFTRLPKGEAATVVLSPKKPVALRFSKHQFWLQGGEELKISSEHNWSQILPAGRNIVGRDRICNVVIDNVYRDVSRIHCLIDFSTPSEVRITDLSAHGTFVPTTALHSP
jgi:FHA domain